MSGPTADLAAASLTELGERLLAALIAMQDDPTQRDEYDAVRAEIGRRTEESDERRRMRRIRGY